MDFQFKIFGLLALCAALFCSSCETSDNEDDFTVILRSTTNPPPNFPLFQVDFSKSDLWNADSIHFSFRAFENVGELDTRAIFVSDNFLKDDSFTFLLPRRQPYTNTGFYFHSKIYFAMNKNSNAKVVYDEPFVYAKGFCKYLNSDSMDVLFENLNFYVRINFPTSTGYYKMGARLRCPRNYLRPE